MLACFLLATTLKYVDGNPLNNRMLGRELWLPCAARSECKNLRVGMVADLESNSLKEGTTREQVGELLGEPSPHSEDVFSYWLGRTDGLGWPRL